MSAKLTPQIPPLPPELAPVLEELVFSTWDPEFLKSEAAKKGREVVVSGRFEDALRFTLPWLSERIDLAEARIVEVGCGSGSSTAALGLHAKSVRGYDIDQLGVRAAEARCRAYGLTNAAVFAVEPETMLRSVADPKNDANVFMLYAVLEHLTYPERLETLSTLWKALPPGGHLVIVETPNRLSYVDHHSTDTEFLHLLPDELALRYVGRAKREAFKIAMREPLAQGPAAASLARIRYGLGASYHEIVLGIEEPLDEIVVADGFEQEMVDFFPPQPDEALLVKFFLDHPVAEPLGFARAVLNLVLRKPRGEEDRAFARGLNRKRREQLLAARKVEVSGAANAGAPSAGTPSSSGGDSLGAEDGRARGRVRRFLRDAVGRIARRL